MSNFNFSKKGLEDYVMDADAELNGVDVPLGDGIVMQVRRAGGSNKEFSKVFQRKIKPYRRKVKAGTLDENTNDRIMHEVYAETIVVGWIGIKDDDGKEIPFSRDACVAFFDTFPEAFLDVVNVANEFSVFAQEQDDDAAEDLGN